jgi:hypothetical protein
VSLVCCFRAEREKARPDTAAREGSERERPKRPKPRGIEYRSGRAGGLARSSDEAPVMGAERRGQVIRGLFVRSTGSVPGGVAWTN